MRTFHSAFLIVLFECLSSTILLEGQPFMQDLLVNTPPVQVFKPDAFNERNLLALARKYLATAHEPGSYWVITDRKHAACLGGPVATEESYDQHKAERDKCLGSFDVARIIHLGASASVEIRFKDGRTLERVVGPKNPLIVGTTGLRIAHLSIKTVNDLVQVSPEDKVSADILLVPVYGEMNLAGIPWDGVYKDLAKLCGTNTIDFEVRLDYIYLEKTYLYPFAKVEKTPNYQNFAKRDAVACVAFQSQLHCYLLVKGIATERFFPLSGSTNKQK